MGFPTHLVASGRASRGIAGRATGARVVAAPQGGLFARPARIRYANDMESPPKNAADVGFFVGFFATITEPQAVLMPVTFAFVIRLYLSFTSYYISGEAGFIFLMTGAVWLFLTTLRNGRIGIALGARAVPGLAYFYRKEGIGLLILGAAFLPAAALI